MNSHLLLTGLFNIESRVKNFAVILFFALALLLSAGPATFCRGMLVSLEGSCGISFALSSKENPAYPAGPVYRQESGLVSWEENSGGSLIVRESQGKALALDLDILKIITQEKIQTVEDYARWLADNFTYRQHEPADTAWNLPGSTLAARRGDCKDLSLLNSAFLRVLGFRPKVLAMARIADSHAICVYRRDGRYYFFDNTKLIRTDAFTFEDFKEYVRQNHQMYFLYEVNLNILGQTLS